MADRGFDTTHWSLIQAAAEGRMAERELFSERYAPALRAYFSNRWKALRQRQEDEDAVQETLLECFRRGGALDRVIREAPGGFRAFLLGVARHVALRFEERHRRQLAHKVTIDWDQVDADEPSHSAAFDRVYASGLLQAAAKLMHERASSEASQFRVELLRLRFAEDLPIREIARKTGRSPEALYQEQYRAREEFREALTEIVRQHHSEDPAEVDEECRRLLEFWA